MSMDRGEEKIKYFTIRPEGETSQWIQEAYEMYRRETVLEGFKPLSLNRYLVSLIEDALTHTAPEREATM